MDKDFEDCIARRCEAALLENEDYINEERKGDADAEELQELAETLCYKKGFSDALNILKCSQKM